MGALLKWGLIGFGIAFIIVPFFGLPTFLAGIGYILLLLGLLYFFTFLV